MKKKLTVNTLAFGNLKKRRKQYTIMIIGIVLAMIFSSGIILFVSGVAETDRAEQYLKCGYQDAIIYAPANTQEAFAAAKQDGIVESYSFAHTIGLAYRAEGEENLGAGVAWLDDETKALSNQTFLAGRYPEDENEIAIEQTALAKLGWENAEIGDEITLLLKVQNGGEYEYLEAVQKTYTLTGIVADKKSHIDDLGYSLVPALYVAQNTQTEIGGREKLVAYVKIDETREVYKSSQYGYAWALTEYFSNYFTGEFAEVVTTKESSYIIDALINNGYIIIISAMLCFASCVAIVNSFNTNLKERRTQIGMMRAVGATRRQIINIFGREAFIISLVATPVSIAASYFPVKILLGFFYDNPVMTKSITVLPIAAAADIAVVMLAALFGLVGAAKITPVQAIRGIDISRKMKVKNIKSKKSFTPASHIAKRNLKLYKSSSLAVSIILAAAIIISCFGFSSLSYYSDVIDEYNTTYKYDYTLYYLNETMPIFDDDIGSFYYYTEQNTVGISESERYEISMLGAVSEVSAQKCIPVTVKQNELNDYIKILNYGQYMSAPYEEDSYESYRADFADAPDDLYYREKSELGIDSDIYAADLVGFDKAQLAALEDCLVAGEINYDKLSSGEEIILVAPQAVQLKAYNEEYKMESAIVCDSDIQSGDTADYETIAEAECTYNVGDVIDCLLIDHKNGDKAEEKQVSVGAIVSPVSVNAAGMFTQLSSAGSVNFSFLTTNDGIDALCPNVNYCTVGVSLSGEINDDINAEMTEKLQYYSEKYQGEILSKYRLVSNAEKEYNSLCISMFAIVIISFAVAAGIINNSITASIRENKRVIGTMRAVGTDRNELVKSYMRRMAFMFSRGTLAGFAAFGVSFALLKIIDHFHTLFLEISFSPWVSIAMAAVLFAVCAANVYSKISKEMKNSIVDNIREL